MTQTQTETNHARENAQAHLDNIRALFAAIEEIESEEAESVTVDGETFTDPESIRDRIREIALSVQVRSDWHYVGDEKAPTEFEILLTTGGPALRVCGELNEYGEPTRAYMQYQDGGTPWTYFVALDGRTVSNQYVAETLLAFAQYFYYGEGR